MKFKIYAPLQMYFASRLLYKQMVRLGKSVEIVNRIDPKDESSIWIIYNNSLSWTVPKYYISYQTEQKGTHWFNDRYYERLSKSLAVWEYNEGNIECYKHCNPNIQIVSTGIDLQPKQPKKIPLLFYGAISERRKKALEDINGITIICDKLGVSMQPILSSAKTVVNIHYYDKSPLETFRINEALSHHCNIVSEHSTSGDSDYADIVTFGNINELKYLVDICEKPTPDLSKFDNFEQIKFALSCL